LVITVSAVGSSNRGMKVEQAGNFESSELAAERLGDEMGA
jgi:hypothetical protein